MFHFFCKKCYFYNFLNIYIRSKLYTLGVSLSSTGPLRLRKKFQQNSSSFIYRAFLMKFGKKGKFLPMLFLRKIGVKVFSFFFIHIFFLTALSSVFKWLRTSINSLLIRSFAYLLPNMGEDIAGFITWRWPDLESHPTPAQPPNHAEFLFLYSRRKVMVLDCWTILSK